MNTIDCPKCRCEHEPSGYNTGEITCKDCGFRFVYEMYGDDYCFCDTKCVEHEWEHCQTRLGEYDACQYCQEINEAR